MTMAMGSDVRPGAIMATGAFLFLAVWVPCCTSDIVFPLLFARQGGSTPAQAVRGHVS
jgi:hypothetical protein